MSAVELLLTLWTTLHDWLGWGEEAASVTRAGRRGGAPEPQWPRAL